MEFWQCLCQILIDFQLLSLLDKGRNFQPEMYKNFHHTLHVLLHYLVKCTTHYYCTVNNKFHVVPNDQQTLLQFIDILNPQLVDILLILLQIVYATRLREGLFNVVI